MVFVQSSLFKVGFFSQTIICEGNIR